MMNKYLIIIVLLLMVPLTSNANPPKKIYLFYGGYCCVDCFKTIKLHTDALIKENKVDSVFVIGRTRNQVLQRKFLKRDISKLLPNYPIIYEFIEQDDPWPPKNLKGGQFGKYNVTLTPAVLVINGNKETFISYETLYKNNFNLTKVIKDMKIGF